MCSNLFNNMDRKYILIVGELNLTLTYNHQCYYILATFHTQNRASLSVVARVKPNVYQKISYFLIFSSTIQLQSFENKQ